MSSNSKETMLLKYTGKRSFVAHGLEGKKYVFDKKNDFINRVPKNSALMLMELGEYVPLPDPIVKEVKKEERIEDKIRSVKNEEKDVEKKKKRRKRKKEKKKVKKDV